MNIEKNYLNEYERLVELMCRSLFMKKEEFYLEARMEADLSIYGDDAYEFLGEYSEVFNVDLSKFQMAKYFSGEFRCYTRVFFFIFPFFKKYGVKKSELTISDLLKGIKYGRLDEEIISKDLDDNVLNLDNCK